MDGIQRSNNVQEGWHNRMNHICIKSHPSLGQFIEMLLDEHVHVINKMKEHLHNALQAPKRSKKNEMRDKRLFLLTSQYNSGVINQEELLIGIIGNVNL